MKIGSALIYMAFFGLIGFVVWWADSAPGPDSGANNEEGRMRKVYYGD